MRVCLVAHHAFGRCTENVERDSVLDNLSGRICLRVAPVFPTASDRSGLTIEWTGDFRDTSCLNSSVLE